jgi:hypothetical protein
VPPGPQSCTCKWELGQEWGMGTCINGLSGTWGIPRPRCNKTSLILYLCLMMTTYHGYWIRQFTQCFVKNRTFMEIVTSKIPKSWTLYKYQQKN